MTTLKIALASASILSLTVLNASSGFALGHDGTADGAKAYSPATDTALQTACVLGKPCVTPTPIFRPIGTPGTLRR